MKYGHASFNTAWVASVSYEKFKEHEAHHGLSEKQMKEAYELCLKAEKESKKRDSAESKIK